MSWGRLGEAVHHAAPEPPHRRDLAQVMDRHIAWQETGTGPGHALSLPALFAVVRLIASNIDQLDLTVDGGPVPDWLRLPRSTGRQPRPGRPHPVHGLRDGAAREGVLAARSAPGRAGGSTPSTTAPSGVQASSFGTVGLSYTFNGEPIERLSYNGYGQERALIHIPYLVTADHPEGTSPARGGVAVHRRVPGGGEAGRDPAGRRHPLRRAGWRPTTT